MRYSNYIYIFEDNDFIKTSIYFTFFTKYCYAIYYNKKYPLINYNKNKKHESKR